MFLLHVSCELFTVYDVLHDAKQKKHKHLRLRSTDWESALKEVKTIEKHASGLLAG